MDSLPQCEKNKYEVTDDDRAMIEKFFEYHPPKDDQPKRYNEIRHSAKVLAFTILLTVPPCADRTAAIRKLRECIMTANAAIACNEGE